MLAYGITALATGHEIAGLFFVDPSAGIMQWSYMPPAPFGDISIFDLTNVGIGRPLFVFDIGELTETITDTTVVPELTMDELLQEIDD